MQRDRDIELLLITGAGASTKFGRQGDIPMMAEWCRILTVALRSPSNLLELVGLDEEMGGEEFERTLGEFLRRAAAFEQIEPLLQPIATVRDNWTVPARRDAGNSQPSWQEWYGNANLTIQDAIERVRASLFQSFGPEQFALGRASRAFSTLLDTLGIGSRSKWIWATTNYDVIPDHAVTQHGGIPDHGAFRPPDGGQTVLRVDRLIDGAPRTVPILHLHGRVGWFRQTATDTDIELEPGNVTRTPEQHVPIVELPSLGKAYSDGVTSSLWMQFREVVQRAQLVFVLGHSLNDDALVEALRDAAPNGLAVANLGEDESPFTALPEGYAVAEKARSIKESAVNITMVFDDRFADNRVPQQIGSWLMNARS